MATLEEVYQNALSSGEERVAFAEAAKTEEDLAAFLAARGCEATPGQALEFLKEKVEVAGELADAELDDVTGGGCGGGGEHTMDKRCPSCGCVDCTFTNERVYMYGRRTYDGHCNGCGANFTYVVG